MFFTVLHKEWKEEKLFWTFSESCLLAICQWCVDGTRIRDNIVKKQPTAGVTTQRKQLLPQAFLAHHHVSYAWSASAIHDDDEKTLKSGDATQSKASSKVSSKGNPKS